MNYSRDLSKALDPGMHKDEILDCMATSDVNVAQFVSFAPFNLKQRYSRLRGFTANMEFSSTEEAIAALLSNAHEKRINIRTFKPDVKKGNPFLRELSDVQIIMDHLSLFSKQGYFIILNESIDIFDSGVSGVIMGDIIEFTPGDTPKGVDKPGICTLQRRLGLQVLRKVYGFTPQLDFDPKYRVEFSLHPLRRGVKHEHTVVWELEEMPAVKIHHSIRWPNNFSRFLGDKVFGLLVADTLGFRVPATTVFGRNVAPFSFGKTTGTAEIWIRTSPVEKRPGQFPTLFGWTDPFKLVQENDPESLVTAVLSQEGIFPQYSGALIFADGVLKVDGVKGRGDEMMVGKRRPDVLPDVLMEKLKKVCLRLRRNISQLSFEWVYDGDEIWIVQLNRPAYILDPSPDVIYPGKVSNYIQFDVKRGLEEFRNFIQAIDLEPMTGIELIGDIAITSHFGDELRNHRIPSRLKRIVE